MRWSTMNGYLVSFFFILPLVLLSFILLDNLSDWNNGALREHGPFGSRPFDKTIVHLDLKGAPPRVSYYRRLFPLLRQLGVEGLLIEYEDMFPYREELAKLPRKTHYSVEEIAEINQLAQDNQLEVIPLVQTFGHLEFVLKHEEFASLREAAYADDSVCPSDPKSLIVIKQMMSQIRQLHPLSTRIHIGADEAYHIAEDSRCEREIMLLGVSGERDASVEKLKLRHIARVAQLARDSNFSQVFAWNDMFDKSSVTDMQAAGLGSLITPVVWGYAADVLRENYFPQGVFARLAQVFGDVWLASAFKGANGAKQTYIDVDRYLQNHRSYVQLYRRFSEDLTGHVRGIVLTGWQRFKHHFPLCELLPLALPSLVVNLMYLKDVKRTGSAMNIEAKMFLNCTIPSPRDVLSPIEVGNSTFVPMREVIFAECDFEEKQLFKLIMVDLRFLSWKARRVHQRGQKGALRKEAGRLKTALLQELEIYYQPEDANEFIEQNMRPLVQYIGRF